MLPGEVGWDGTRSVGEGMTGPLQGSRDSCFSGPWRGGWAARATQAHGLACTSESPLHPLFSPASNHLSLHICKCWPCLCFLENSEATPSLPFMTTSHCLLSSWKSAGRVPYPSQDIPRSGPPWWQKCGFQAKFPYAGSREPMPTS